jgi:hypothetical protein
VEFEQLGLRGLALRAKHLCTNADEQKADRERKEKATQIKRGCKTFHSGTTASQKTHPGDDRHPGPDLATFRAQLGGNTWRMTPD